MPSALPASSTDMVNASPRIAISSSSMTSYEH
jgi:hypothetical protein